MDDAARQRLPPVRRRQTREKSATGFATYLLVVSQPGYIQSNVVGFFGHVDRGGRFASQRARRPRQTGRVASSWRRKWRTKRSCSKADSCRAGNAEWSRRKVAYTFESVA